MQKRKSGIAKQRNRETPKPNGFYAYGDDVTKNNVEAAKWYRKAAEQGNANAQLFLGTCYANGEGVAKDETEAVKWYRKAAEQGKAAAQYCLGLECSGAEAVRWFRMAAEQGYAEAIEALKGMNAL